MIGLKTIRSFVSLPWSEYNEDVSNHPTEKGIVPRKIKSKNILSGKPITDLYGFPDKIRKDTNYFIRPLTFGAGSVLFLSRGKKSI